MTKCRKGEIAGQFCDCRFECEPRYLKTKTKEKNIFLTSLGIKKQTNNRLILAAKLLTKQVQQMKNFQFRDCRFEKQKKNLRDKKTQVTETYVVK